MDGFVAWIIEQIVRYDRWVDARDNDRAIRRIMRRNAREQREHEKRTHHIVHRSRTVWLFSGTVRNENGVMQDAGFLRSPKLMNRKQALKYFAKQFPRGNIVHVDDRNKIITYSF